MSFPNPPPLAVFECKTSSGKRSHIDITEGSKPLAVKKLLNPTLDVFLRHALHEYIIYINYPSSLNPGLPQNTH